MTLFQVFFHLLFLFLFVFFRHIFSVLFFIFFIVFLLQTNSSANFLHAVLFYFFSSWDNPLYWSRAIFATFLCSIHNTVYPFLYTFLFFFLCLVIFSGVLFDNTIITNFFHNHNCALFLLKSAFFILFIVLLLVMSKKWIL